MLSDYQPVFKYKNNFKHFQTFVKGLIFTPSRGTMTQIYQSTKLSTTYWTLPSSIIDTSLVLSDGFVKHHKARVCFHWQPE